jgi:hypothetical protein
LDIFKPNDSLPCTGIVFLIIIFIIIIWLLY